jgi:hypothetical protein
MTVTGSGSLETLLLVVLLVLRHCSLSTRWTMLVRVLPMTPSPPKVEENVNSMVLWTSTKRHSHLMVLLAFTVALFLQLLVSSSTAVFTSVYTTPLVCIVVISTYHSLTFFAEPVVLVGALEGSFLASFGLGWGVTIGAGLASYPLDTIR